VDGCRHELSAAVTHRALDVGVDETWSSSGAAVGRGGAVVPVKGIRDRGCGDGWVLGHSAGPLGGRERGRALAGDCRRWKTGTSPRAAGTGQCTERAALLPKQGRVEPLTGGPPLQCWAAGPIRFKFEL
jgi:hypothetical protein